MSWNRQATSLAAWRNWLPWNPLINHHLLIRTATFRYIKPLLHFLRRGIYFFLAAKKTGQRIAHGMKCWPSIHLFGWNWFQLSEISLFLKKTPGKGRWGRVCWVYLGLFLGDIDLNSRSINWHWYPKYQMYQLYNQDILYHWSYFWSEP